MKIEFSLFNCFWMIVPLLAWNLAFGRRISQDAIISDAHSPKWLLFAENFSRILVFALPLLLPLQWKDAWSKAGLALYIIGTVIYFGSWLPLISASKSGWSSSPVGLLAPRLTPWLSFLGIALTGGSWLYGVIAAVFICFHTWHGIQNL